MLPTRFAAVLLLLAPAGCKKEEKLADLFAGVSDAASGVYAGEAVGEGSATAAVFATNGYGAAVDGGVIELSSDGSLDAATTTPDATGWGSATVSGPGGWTLTAITGGAQAEGHLTVTSATPGTTGFPAWPAADRPDFVAPAGNGLAIASGNEIWWTASDGTSLVRVAEVPGEIRGMEAVQGEADGVADVLAWTEDAVFFLRGRSAGGLFWGGGWETSNGTVTGAVGRDLDGDAAMDLAVLVVDGEASSVSVYGGDGAWDFALSDRLDVPYAAWSLSAEDLDLDGARELTLLTADSLVRRYARFEDGWSTSGSYEYDVALAEGARLHPGVDLTADGIEDLLVAGPDAEGTGWQAWIIDAGANATVFQMFNPDAEGLLPGAASVATGELSGDGVADVLLLTDTTLYAGFWNVLTEAFTLYAYPDVPADAPLAIADVTGDALGDAIVAGSQLTTLQGQRVEDDPDTSADESVAWKVQTPSAKVTDFSLALPPVVRDYDGDGIVDLATAAATASGVELQVYGGTPADADSDEGFRSRGAVVLSTTGTALELAVCDDQLYVLVSESTGTWLHHYRFNSGGAPVSAAAPVAVGGDQLACGPFALGDVAVVSVGGEIGYVDGTSVTSDPGSGEAAYDAASVESGGTRSVVTCPLPGCSVAVADFDGDGAEEVARADGADLSLESAAGTSVVYAPGVVSAADADGDGIMDVVVADVSEVRVYRAAGGRLSVPSATYVWRPSLGPAAWGDLDGDALPDLFLRGWDYDAGDATDWTGTLIYAHATPAP